MYPKYFSSRRHCRGLEHQISDEDWNSIYTQEIRNRPGRLRLLKRPGHFLPQNLSGRTSRRSFTLATKEPWGAPPAPSVTFSGGTNLW